MNELEKFGESYFPVITEAMNKTEVFIFILNDRGRILSVNNALKKFTGYAGEELTGLPFWEALLNEDEADLFSVFFQSLHESDYPYSHENYLQTKDGKHLPVIWSETLISYQGEKYIIGYGFDNTEKKQEELILRDQSDKIQKTIEASPLALIITDTRSIVKRWNLAATQLFGWKEVDVVSSSNPVFPMDSVSDYQVLYKHVLQGKTITGYEIKGYKKDGGMVYLNCSMAPLRNFEGVVNGLVIMALDITAQKEAEEALRISERNLAIAYRKLDEEVGKAELIHRSVIQKELPEMEGVSVATYYQPSERMGGDFYYVTRSGNKLLFYISDVMGHGIGGALISMFVKECIGSYLELNGENMTTEKVLRYLYKRYVNNGFADEQLVCLFVGILNLDTLELSYSSVGFQILPALVTGGDKKELIGGGLPITNVVPLDLLNLKEYQVTLNSGDLLFVSSDGLLEQEKNGKMFEKLYREVIGEYKRFPVDIVRMAVNKEFILWNGSEVGADDITFMIIKTGPEHHTTHRFELNSKKEELVVLLNILEEKLVPLPQEKISNILMCAYELVLNAMEHGNKYDEKKTVKIAVNISDDYVILNVEDEGDGFDWLCRLTGEMDLTGESDRGRGVYMADLMSYGLFYHGKGNKVTLVV